MQDKITKSAKGENCSLRIYGVCSFDDSTVVFAHAPSVKKGWGIKSPSFWGCYACHKCHDYIDGRVKTGLNKDQLCGLIMPAIFETQNKLIEKGLLKYD